jgi:predicted amidohydrolase
MQFKLGICQLKIGHDKQENLQRAARLMDKTADQGADMVILPEMFNCPYDQALFHKYAEEEGGETSRFLAEWAQKLGRYVVGGSIPEKEAGHIFNTSLIFDRQGNLIAKHRKVHLFDINIPGGITFQESAVLTPGEQFTTFTTEFGRCGVLICYDLRFPEAFRLFAEDNTGLVIIPAAFNMTTGPAHWETLFRARAIDNQLFIAGVSPARDPGAGYVAYGHSMVVDPWGQILGQADAGEEVLVVPIDSQRLAEVRQGLPLLKHRRLDLYQVTRKR